MLSTIETSSLAKAAFLGCRGRVFAEMNFPAEWVFAPGEGSSSLSPFPADPVREYAKAAESASGLPLVLLVEDNAADVYVIREILKKCGVPLNLVVVTDGEDATAILRASSNEKGLPAPALVLLDWNLPKISGAQVLSQMRGNERWANVPVIIVTSTKAQLEIHEIVRLGATAYFPKPNDLDSYMKLSEVILQTLPRST